VNPRSRTLNLPNLLPGSVSQPKKLKDGLPVECGYIKVRLRWVKPSERPISQVRNA